MDTLTTTTVMTEDLYMLWQKLAITILIGLLIGIERERRKKIGEKSFAGIRTFPLIAILGFLSALISSIIRTELYIVFFFVFGCLVAVSYYFSTKKGGVGGTNEITLLLIFVLGSLVYWDYILLSGAVAVILIIFLTFKTEFHAFAGKIEQEDIYATIKFAIITIIILPLLPDQTYGPFNVLNPRTIWYMVILIAGISFVGYIIFKLIGAHRGIQLLSVLGGLASSTATTLSFTHQSKMNTSLSRNFAAGIVLASTIMFPRILLIIFLVHQPLAEILLVPTAIFTLVGIVISFFLWRKTTTVPTEELNLTNPFRVFTALKFGLLFAVILVLSSAAQHYSGDSGVYITSIFAGFADLDAIALSMADLVRNTISIHVAATGIIIAFAANTVVKLGIASIFGSKELRKYSAIGFSVLIVVLLAYLIFVFM